MSWSISTRDIARIRSFEAAKKHWESQLAWKTDYESWRPLATRRARHKRIVKLSEDRGYECVLYQTALVTYYTDGSVALRTHDTQSSIKFANCVSPQGCSPLNHKSRMFWQVRTDEGARFYIEGDQALILTPTAKGNWCLTTQPAEIMEWVYDRKKGTEVQKMLRPYTAWYKLTERMGGIPQDNLMLSLSRESGNAAYVRDHIADPENFMTLARHYGPLARIRHVLYEAHGARYKTPTPHTSLPKEFA